MKTLNRIVSLALVLGACAFFSGSASAQVVRAPTVPQACKASRDNKAWTAGVTAGDSRIVQVYKSAMVNQDLDVLSDKLPSLLTALEQTMVSLVNGQTVDNYVRCRAQGYVDGYFYRLNKLFGQCVLDGADWGQFAANLYCALSIDLGGLAETALFVRAPVGLCGNLFEATCEDLFRYVGLEGNYSIQPIVASYLEVSGFTPEPFAGCAEYTDNAFLNVFQQSLHNDCTYVVQQ